MLCLVVSFVSLVPQKCCKKFQLAHKSVQSTQATANWTVDSVNYLNCTVVFTEELWTENTTESCNESC